MRPAETTARLARFAGRGPGSDAERRAALWLARELASGGRETQLEPFWCRPNWAIAHSWHVALALAGSLVSVTSPRVGGVLIVVALVSMITDEQLGVSLGRRLSPERASQNVIATPGKRASTAEQPVRLIITANYDAGRTALVYRSRPRRAAAWLRQTANGVTPGWMGWLAIILAWLLATAIARTGGARGAGIGVVQLVPTVALVLTLAALIDMATGPFGPAAGDNASGVGVALAIASALDAAPPRHVEVDLVLAGAGEGGGVGLKTFLRSRKRDLSARNAVVLGIAPCAAGTPRWWVSDGPLVPLRYFGELRKLSARLAKEEPGIGARPQHGRGATPALRGRLGGLPAIAIGCLDELGLSPRSHQASDTPETLDSGALDAAVEFGLMLADAIDGYVGRLRAPATPRPTPA